MGYACVHQAIDLQPEEPRAGQRSSDTTSLRVRLSRFNTAVLRVVAANVAGLPDSEQVQPATLLLPHASSTAPASLFPLDDILHASLNVQPRIPWKSMAALASKCMLSI